MKKLLLLIPMLFLLTGCYSQQKVVYKSQWKKVCTNEIRKDKQICINEDRINFKLLATTPTSSVMLVLPPIKGDLEIGECYYIQDDYTVINIKDAPEDTCEIVPNI